MAYLVKHIHRHTVSSPNNQENAEISKHLESRNDKAQ